MDSNNLNNDLIIKVLSKLQNIINTKETINEETDIELSDDETEYNNQAEIQKENDKIHADDK